MSSGGLSGGYGSHLVMGAKGCSGVQVSGGWGGHLIGPEAERRSVELSRGLGITIPNARVG